MTKPRLAKVRALFYVLQQVTKEAAPILTQPPSFIREGSLFGCFLHIAVRVENYYAVIVLCEYV